MPRTPTPLVFQFVTLKKTKQHCARFWKNWRGTILFGAFVLTPVKSILADWNWVPTGSMNPTILEGDLVYINKLAYDLRVPLTLKRMDSWSDPQRGDVTVLLSPEDKTRLVKRVIGIPGDEIKMLNNTVFLNGRMLEYSPLSLSSFKGLPAPLKDASIFAEETLGGSKHAVMSTPPLPSQHRSFDTIVIPEGFYFVMGDNRDNSKDSRVFGLVERRLFLGKATGVIASFNILEKYQPRPSRFFKPLD